MKYCFFLIFFLFTSQALSLSCKRIKDRVFVSCQDGKCTDIIFIKELKTGEGCRRRPVIADPPDWAKDAIGYEISLGNKNSTDTIYELSISYRWWSRTVFNSLEEYKRHKSGGGGRPLIHVDFLTHYENSISNILIEWQKKESQAYLKMINRKISWWLKFITCLVVMIIFVSQLLKAIEKRKTGLMVMTFVTFLISSIILIVFSQHLGSYDLYLLIILPGLILINFVALIRLLISNSKS